MKAIKNVSKRINKIKVVKLLKNNYIAKCNYIKYYKKYEIDEKIILLESQHGREINGNIYYIICELLQNPEYKDYRLYLSVRKIDIEKIKEFLKRKNITNINYVIRDTNEYFKIISKAKFLINDNTFLPFFIKKEGQVYLNTWHGTPLKSLGKKIKNDLHNIGNTQKNFVVADYLLYPNEYTKDHMIEDYMIENLAKNTIILEGYPRNTIFFDNNQRKELKNMLELNNKQIIVYMPTWRGTLNKKNTSEQKKALNEILDELEQRLSDKQILYVNVHPIERATIDYTKYSKIKPFPAEYETYEFLNIADVLITDYSSVFFDFANTKKKIILYPYDKEQYLADRGVYMNLEELPFPIVYNTDELVEEIESPKNYDDTEFLNKFCAYDSKNATKRICERVILNKKNNIKEEKMIGNGKENVFIYPGGLEGNGITAALTNLLKIIDKDKRNYYLLIDANVVNKNKEKLLEMSEYINFLGIKGKINLTLIDKLYYILYGKRKLKFNRFIKRLKEKYEFEVKRVLGDIDVNTIIQYSGYSYKKTLLFSTMKCNKAIYVHSNMRQEIDTRHNQREDALRYAYNKYDHVVAITDYIADVTTEFLEEENKDRIIVAKNFINNLEIKEKSNKEIALDNKTTMNVSLDELETILNSNSKKFINVGRFSVEKGQQRLIDSFDKLWQQDPSIYLILIGGHGNLYGKILKYINSLPSKENIIIIKSISNPFPIVKKCDYFVLSSLYEGFGLVLAEADILNLSVISTDIGGPRMFMKENGGTLVENSEEGIYEGMKMLLDGKINPMNVDYEKYNKEAIEQFERILK